MSDHVYKTVEITGTSSSSIEEAVGNAVRRASKTIHNLRWLEVVSVRGEIDGETVAHWQVTAKLGFTLEE